ncbi:GNAT family N-acetyltransferase [Paraclostridium sordellii]|uniref:GNAT family N-acetyltransferase n=1 Tax=Paraclostridium sordellii TaxID=1505 RepID=UPI0005E8EA47|nr:GNAT family N-acetyltransferase [Paeniclostridium sordellii]CEN89209.1 GNAT family acetyltransferase [[Clostridium] sordellii] [Paeniclostridium sordellii]CEQ13053.1 GNAT family acetyltransferase [[Clostridium] sordellii] [Paeniclostridium sordellii]
MKFIKVDNKNQIYCDDIYNILRLCGEDMYKNNGLKHWINPYPIESIKKDLRTKRVFILKEDKKPIATFTLSEEKTNYFNDTERFIYLSKFAVNPNESRKGIGKKCLQYIEEICRIEGFEGIRLDVYDQSYSAISFYLKNNFEKLFIAETRNFNVICMEKRVK